MILIKTLIRSKLIIVLILLQGFASAYLLSEQLAPQGYFNPEYKLSKWLLGLIGLLSILAISQIKNLIKIAEVEAEAQLTTIHLRESQEMLDTLRAQRHDFLNHLQAITGLIQLGKPEKASDYANEVIMELSDEKGTEYTGEPEINALLLKMIAMAEEKGIKIDFTITKELDLGIPVPPTKMARIVGNLLRNSIEAVENLSPDQRWVKFAVERQPNSWILRVNNPGPGISKEDCERVFETGFSTKAKNGRGLGLSIVRKITQEYRGNIQLVSSPESGTVFTVYLPVKSEDSRE
ncbi:MAG: ATP-binding protein [Clostridia bacterium]|nr:ATP-binding protein [Clostridia bacterium]